MAVTIKIDERSKAGKTLLDLARILSENSTGIEIKNDFSESSYDADFVQKIKKAESEKSIEINTSELWESI